MAEEKGLTNDIEKEKVTHMISQINVTASTVVSRLHAHLTKATAIAKDYAADYKAYLTPAYASKEAHKIEHGFASQVFTPLGLYQR